MNGDQIRKRLLVVDDEGGHRLMVKAVMGGEGWQVREAATGEQGVEALRSRPPHVVLMDLRMPGMGGEEAMRRMRELHPEVPVVMLTAHGTVGSAVEAMKKGAFDYLTKPVDNDELAAVLEKAFDYGRYLQDAGAGGRVEDATGIIVGDSEPIGRVREFIAQAGPSEATILIQGESGTGKELIAESLHGASARRDAPLVKVNCAALPDNLLESELFGYDKGAFTGAMKNKPGRFQLAHGGTLFLDEIGEMAMNVQAKLLRALQERVVEPLGSVRQVPVDVRIVAATNRNLEEEVANGTFREDLFYRLNVLEVNAPPLRDHLEDIPLLVSHLAVSLSARNGKSIRGVSPLFLDALKRHDWPGNVRELANVLERAIILSPVDTLGPESLPAKLRQEASQHGEERDTGVSDLEQAEKEALVKALDKHDGHRERTADYLGISRRTLQYKLSKYGLTRR